LDKSGAGAGDKGRSRREAKLATGTRTSSPPAGVKNCCLGEARGGKKKKGVKRGRKGENLGMAEVKITQLRGMLDRGNQRT